MILGHRGFVQQPNVLAQLQLGQGNRMSTLDESRMPVPFRPQFEH